MSKERIRQTIEGLEIAAEIEGVIVDHYANLLNEPVGSLDEKDRRRFREVVSARSNRRRIEDEANLWRFALAALEDKT